MCIYRVYLSQVCIYRVYLSQVCTTVGIFPLPVYNGRCIPSPCVHNGGLLLSLLCAQRWVTPLSPVCTTVCTSCSVCTTVCTSFSVCTTVVMPLSSCVHNGGYSSLLLCTTVGVPPSRLYLRVYLHPGYTSGLGIPLRTVGRGIPPQDRG